MNVISSYRKHIKDQFHFLSKRLQTNLVIRLIQIQFFWFILNQLAKQIFNDTIFVVRNSGSSEHPLIEI